MTWTPPRCHNPHPATRWQHRLLHNIDGRWVCEDCVTQTADNAPAAPQRFAGNERSL